MIHYVIASVLFVLTVILWTLAFNAGLSLMNQPDTFLAAGGLLLVIALAAVAACVVARFFIKHKGLGKLLIIVAALSCVTACTRIGPGQVGIKVNMAGSDRGVSEYPLLTGWVFYNPASSSVFEWPTYVQTAKWVKSASEGNPINEEITFTNKDQMQIGADISIGYHLDAPKVPAFYVKFRTDDMNAFTHGFLRNSARDVFDRFGGRYTIEQIMGDNAQFLADVRGALQADMSPYGVELDQFGFIGAPRPPEAIQKAISDKAEAAQITQKKEQEVRQAEAEARSTAARADGEARAILAVATAQAQANRLINESLTPNLIQYKSLEKWNGTLPTVTGGATPFINLPAR